MAEVGSTVAARAPTLLRAVRAAGDALARIPRPVGFALAVLWAAFVRWLSSGPPPVTPIGWRWAFAFNLAHAPLYGVLALLAALALPRDGARPRWPRLGLAARAVVLLLIALYGLADEWHQSATPERMATWRDVLTDLVGAGAALAVAAYAARPSARAGPLALRVALGLCACLAAAGLATR